MATRIASSTPTRLQGNGQQGPQGQGAPDRHERPDDPEREGDIMVGLGDLWRPGVDGQRSVAPRDDEVIVREAVGIGLVNLVSRLNHGLDPGGNPIGEPTRFVAGVGVNPTAPDLERELKRFAWKVEAGAEFAVTQPVFDLEQLDRFLARVERFRIPIVAGIWPLVSLRNAEFLANEVPGVSVPGAVLERMRRASAAGKEAGLAEGVAIAREMLAAARDRVQGVQVAAPLGRVPVALEVLR